MIMRSAKKGDPRFWDKEEGIRGKKKKTQKGVKKLRGGKTQ